MQAPAKNFRWNCIIAIIRKKSLVGHVHLLPSVLEFMEEGFHALEMMPDLTKKAQDIRDFSFV